MKKRILLRASVSPFQVSTPEEVIFTRVIGNNTGNLLFAYSMTRTLFTDDTQVDFLADKTVIHDKITPEYINENYDYLVLPMANSFRNQFLGSMRKWTALIERLTIPCVVTGIGIQMPYEPDITEPHKYDEDSKRFVKAVLNHSASIGVRGEITYKYLKHLGFNDVDVTGCPSIEMFGPGLPVREPKPLTKDSKVCVTGSVSNPVNFKEFMIRNREVLPNYYFMPQLVDDLKLMYYGVPLPATEASQTLYPHMIDDEVFVNDKARFFIDFQSILKFNQGIDFNYGTRIHGAVGNILAGVPTILFPTDARIRELAEYHNIPNMPAHDVNESTNIFELYENTDFTQVNNGHEERFWHFVDFLDNNGLPHIYKDRDNIHSPFDEKIKDIEFYGPVHSLYTCDEKEQVQRLITGQRMMYNSYNTAIDDLKTKNANQKMIIKENNKKLKRLEWYDNSSSMHIAGSRAKSKLKGIK